MSENYTQDAIDKLLEEMMQNVRCAFCGDQIVGLMRHPPAKMVMHKTCKERFKKILYFHKKDEL